MVRDGVAEAAPYEIAPAHPITKDTVGGNLVVLDLGQQRWAVYAHLQPGSLRVNQGDWVQKGEVIARLGNSAAYSAHLHFQIVDGPEPFSSEGVPFVFDEFTHEGKAHRDEMPAGGLDHPLRGASTALIRFFFASGGCHLGRDSFHAIGESRAESGLDLSGIGLFARTRENNALRQPGPASGQGFETPFEGQYCAVEWHLERERLTGTDVGYPPVNRWLPRQDGGSAGASFERSFKGEGSRRVVPGRDIRPELPRELRTYIGLD
jgi:hypothetical protein